MNGLELLLLGCLGFIIALIGFSRKIKKLEQDTGLIPIKQMETQYETNKNQTQEN